MYHDNIKKEINELLDTILEDYSHIINNFKTTATKKEEMESIVYGKKHTISLCTKICEIYKKLMELKYNQFNTIA